AGRPPGRRRCPVVADTAAAAGRALVRRARRRGTPADGRAARRPAPRLRRLPGPQTRRRARRNPPRRRPLPAHPHRRRPPQRPATTVIQPLGQDAIDDAIAAAATPAARLTVALAGIHAARSSAVCALRLSDAGPGSRRLLLGGQPRPLDDLTAHLLRAWLENRRTRWPGTANPHLLINAQTALGTGPVSRTWVNTALRGHTATIEALRVDRQLEEAMATGADPLH